MNLDQVGIIPIDKAFKESERLFELYNLSTTSWIELEPDTLRPSFDEYRKSMLKEKDNIWETKNFACEYEGKLIGSFWLHGLKINAKAPRTEKETGYFQCFVLEEFRRRGVASKMLIELVKQAEYWGMRKVLCGGYDKVPSNEFCRHFGGEMVSLEIERKLRLSDANWEIIEKYSKPTTKNSNIRVVFHNENPVDQKEEYFNIYADFCVESYALEKEPDRNKDFFVKEMEEEDKIPPEEKDEIIIALAKTPDGKIAGLTNITIDRNNPSQSHQHITGVQKDYRGKGIGLRLKALTALNIRANFPQVESITTYTSNENIWMANINEAMGFMVTSKNEMYRFEVEQLGSKLGVV